MQSIEFIIQQVDASMTMEDMPLTEEDKERIRFCIGDNKKVKQEVQKLVQQYSVKLE